MPGRPRGRGAVRPHREIAHVRHDRRIPAPARLAGRPLALEPRCRASTRSSASISAAGPARREEAVAEARAAAWAAWCGLIRRGRDPVAVGVAAIAANACRGVRRGRKVGNPTVGRGAMDVQHPEARRRLGLRVIPFEEVAGPPSASWQDWLAADPRFSPADEACFRIDFAGPGWAACRDRKRRVAELLPVGPRHGRGGLEVSRRHPRGDQPARSRLARSWRSSRGRSWPEPPAAGGHAPPSGATLPCHRSSSDPTPTRTSP